MWIISQLLHLHTHTHTQNERIGLNNLWRPFQLSLSGQGHLSLSDQHWSPDLNRCNLILRLVPSKATWRILLHSLEQPLPPNGRCTLFLPWGTHTVDIYTPTHSTGKKTGQCSPPRALELSLFTEVLQRCGFNLSWTLLRMFILTWSGQAHLVGNTLAFGIRQLWSWNMVSLFWSFRILGNWLSYSEPKFPVRWISSHF